MKKIHLIWMIPVGLILMVGLYFGAGYLGVFGKEFWGTKMATAKRHVYENSQSYVEGKRQELIKYYHEYSLADSAGKESIKSFIRLSFANFEDEKIENYQLKQFLLKMKYD